MAVESKSFKEQKLDAACKDNLCGRVNSTNSTGQAEEPGSVAQ